MGATVSGTLSSCRACIETMRTRHFSRAAAAGTLQATAGPIRRIRMPDRSDDNDHSHPKETQEMTKMSMLAASALVAARSTLTVAYFPACAGA